MKEPKAGQLPLEQMIARPSADCCGCGACRNACAQQAIRMEEDEDGFAYPSVDHARCTSCGACTRACPALGEAQAEAAGPKQKGMAGRLPQTQAFAAVSRDAGEREQSSSGGIFSLLARQTLAEGGVVFGAAFDEAFSVHHIGVETCEELSALRGSKYVQSRIELCFRAVRAALAKGRPVLFSGTPCQCAGLRAFLGPRAADERLFLVDFICHGVPSPAVWRAYLAPRRQRGELRTVLFRSKQPDWEHFALAFGYADGRREALTLEQDPYLRTFLHDIDLRPSCYACRYRQMERPTDLTLADAWGASEEGLPLSDHRGTSLVLLHSERARARFAALAAETALVSLPQLLPYNPSLLHQPQLPPMRAQFFSAMRQGEDIERLMRRVLRGTARQRLKQAVKRLPGMARLIGWIRARQR